MIKNCTCKHAFQDKIYGPGRRWHVKVAKKGPSKGVGYACSVCGIIKGEASE